MREICVCGNKALLSIPLKYSPDDKFGSYRRKAKIQEYIGKGFL